jgi:hypothetical protein
MKLLGDLGIYPQITQIKKPETRNQKLETKKSLPVELPPRPEVRLNQ